ncbi:hypothetical protein TNCV_3654191 [Trichonephila clavipes]|nr:hypothetical protein TNCV_3654191 [Trichonephila clavipes]
MVLKTTANDRRKFLAPWHDEFRGLRSDTVRQVALETTREIRKIRDIQCYTPLAYFWEEILNRGNSFGQELSSGAASVRRDRGQDCFLASTTRIFSQKE